MVPWWKRLLYSFVSVLVGVAVVCAALWILSAPRPKMGWETIVDYGYFTLMWSFPGWLVAVPVVLLVKNYYGWRMWFWGGIGCCIGPLLLLGMAAFTFLTNPLFAGFASGSWKFLLLAGAVSSVTTAVYLMLVTQPWPSSSQLLTSSSRSKNA